MIRALLSDDPPGGALLNVALLALLAVLVAAPFLLPGAQALNVAAKIAYFVVLAASYDLLLGYAGIVSFAHTMFFGIGAYGVAIAIGRLGPSWGAVGLGTAAALAASTALALAVALFSLRVRAIFFSMITLAVATAFAILASQLGSLTGGEDGLTFPVPPELRAGFRLLEGPVFGVALNGRIVAYYGVLGASLALFLLLLRVVNSPFGRALQAIRENDFRAEALGYRVVVLRAVATAVSAAAATLAGVLCALWLRYTGPAVTLSFDIMLDLLLMVVIGGMGTLYGAALGATVVLLAESYLQAGLGALHRASEGLPALAALLHPDRWLLWLGLLFIASVYLFPQGIVGALRGRRAGGSLRSTSSS